MQTIGFVGVGKIGRGANFKKGISSDRLQIITERVKAKRKPIRYCVGQLEFEIGFERLDIDRSVVESAGGLIGRSIA